MTTTSRITDESIFRVREANPIADVIRRNVSLGESSEDGCLSGACVFCESDSGDFYVHILFGLWICLDCGESGDVIAWVRKLDGVTFPQAVELLAERADVKVQYDDPDSWAATFPERAK